MRSHDFLILGGGVTGLTTALRLAEQGGRVAVLERGRTGREASWAGAGMLPPGNLDRAEDAESRLRGYSHALWQDFADTLYERTGIDTGFRICGCLEIEDPNLPNELAQIRRQLADEQIEFRHLTNRRELQECVEGLHPTIQTGAFLPGFGQVRNPRHMKALLAACLDMGVTVHEETAALSLVRSGDRVLVRDHTTEYIADRILIAAGAWSNELLRQSAIDVQLPVFPVRGQILQLRCSRLPFRCVIQQGRRYVVPRPDGLMLVGSTEERCGFEKRTTGEGIQSLLEFAVSVVPALGDAEVVTSWAGLRPGSADELPMIGRLAGLENLFVAAGHFRSGLQMSVGTAWVLADLMMDREPAISLNGLSPDRFDASQASTC